MNNATKSTTANTKAISKMSDTVISCELRGAYSQLECDLRHGIQPGRTLSDYIAALTAEQNRRKAG